VLGELLHSLSQPLTGLLCSLELSLQLPCELPIEQVAAQQQANVSVALQQTEKVIGMIQLMREYLDAEQPAPEAFSSALAPATRSVIEELSSIAAVRDVRLRLVGTCVATVPVPESRLRLALQYLITTLIEAQPGGGKVMLLLGEGPAGAVLRAEGESGRQQQKPSATSPQTMLRRARIAIADRVLESAGASLVFGGGDVDPAGFVLRIPRRVAARD
jgi:signal transduction histidine kinase